jgi:hypothetical protein
LTSAQDAYPVRTEFPADAPRELARPGSLVQATVFTDEGNPINVLANILMWISAWMAYVFWILRSCLEVKASFRACF